MFRLRRSRVFLVLAVFAIIALYHFTSFGNLGYGNDTSIEGLKHLTSKGPKHSSSTSSESDLDRSTVDNDAATKESVVEDALGVSSESDENKDGQAASTAPASLVEDADEDSEQPKSEELSSSSQRQDTEELSDPKNNSKSDNEPATVADGPAEPVLDVDPDIHGQGRFEVIAAANGEGMPKIHWSRLPEHFPIPTKSLIPLPTDKAKAIPKIQLSEFPTETSEEKEAREAKLDTIKKTFAFSWDGYRKNAWMQDELSPVSGNYRNPFCGWAATLVDSLDSLWMLGMKAEFEEAVEAVRKLDFTTSMRNDLPLFEVTIRYLGGLVAAYELGGSKYKILLDKAVELAEVLMGAFDTPNRMPMTFYLWKPTFASQPHRAKTRVVLAEIGSLSMEFTRLAQITKETKYYDAIARITDEFEKWQDNTKIPGLWPKQVDASGCKKPESIYVSPTVSSAQKGASFSNEQYPQIAGANDETTTDGKVDKGASVTDKSLGTDAGRPATIHGDGIEKRQVSDDSESSSESARSRPDCVAQGLSSPPGAGWDEFTIGGMADSVYEYLPKEYMLLGGLEQKYQTMYEKAAEAAKKHLLFRPMIEEEERSLLVAALISTSGKPNTPRDPKIKYEQSHLGCFAGGMFAVGARIFDRKEDLDVAKRLTDGCVWAYEMTTTGIMPEHFLVVPCADQEACPFNKTLWYEELYPYHSRARSQTPASQSVPVADDQESSGQAGGGTDTSTSNASESQTVKQAALDRRQLGEIDNDKLNQRGKEGDSDELTHRASDTDDDGASDHSGEKNDEAGPKAAEAASETGDASGVEDKPTSTTVDDGVAEPVKPVVEAYTPPPIPSQEEYALSRIRDEKLPKGVTKITSSRYILRPEAIESVFIMYRVTGDEYWRTKGWKMFTSIQNYTRAEFGASAISDVMSENPFPADEMESFWLAETLKYFYLLFSEPDVYSLDDYVLNTEAHPFRRPK
ncbi:MAG: hypothetical protein Q9215_000043 [Flavoplaca cf. flavocitrina]